MDFFLGVQLHFTINLSKSFDNGTLIAYSAAAEIAKTVAVLFLLNVIAPFIKSKFTTAETAKGGMAKRERNTTVRPLSTG